MGRLEVRANPVEYQMVAPRNLESVLALLAQQPGAWLPIAGGTDVMVQYSAGNLGARKLVSIWNLPELRRIEVAENEIRIGAGCTYTDLRRHELIRTEFPLLATAAQWTGGIANQNRGTIGGNIVNASPAADSLPALLAYEADLILVSSRAERRVPYGSFHVSYRKTRLAADELIREICIARKYADYFAYTRKVGARNAQAISKVCLAASGKMSDGIVEDVRLAMGSVAPVPLRLSETESVIRGKALDAGIVKLARSTAAGEVRPIDDIRSTARYRAAVAGNLVEEFLVQLDSAGSGVCEVLSRWNALVAEEAAAEILPCFGSKVWAAKMVSRRPIRSAVELLAACDDVCKGLAESDWLEAFQSHPRIGESSAASSNGAKSAVWSGEEQRRVGSAAEHVKAALAEGNRAYEQRFHRTFIVCATGKSAQDILEILRGRLANDDATEFRQAAEQQRQIAHIRLKKWLTS
jgi:OHCU decarboxylase